MGDIDNKRITSISDTANAMPVYWSTAAQDIRWNNAIILGVTIARQVDKMNLWDGLFHVREQVGFFDIVPRPKIIIEDMNDNLIFNKEEPIDIHFSQTCPSITIQSWPDINIDEIYVDFPSAIAPRLPLTSTALLSRNQGDSSIYIEMRNPINIGNGTYNDNKSAFQVIVTVGTVIYQPTIVNFTLEKGLNVIWLDLDSDIMKESSQVITVIYDSTKGTLWDSFNNEKITSFQTGFNFTVSS